MAKNEGSGMGIFEGVLDAAFTKKLVDVVLTPRGVASPTTGNNPGEEADSEKPIGRTKRDVSMKYVAFDELVVSVQQKGGDASALVLTSWRQRFADWKLSRLRLRE